jgi:hypothetical protein
MKNTNNLKIKAFLPVFLACLALSLPASAEPKAWAFGWWPGHWTWTHYKKFNPYLENGKQAQSQQWDAEDWYVDDWVSQVKNGQTLIDGFFRTDILREQDDEGGTPVLYVGPQFYRLGGLDKRRVVTTLDTVYGITETDKKRIIKLRDWHTKRDIGIYTKDGLQLE